MHKVAFTATAAAGLVVCGTLIGGGAEAAPISAPHAIRTTVDGLDMIENVQFIFGGRRYCWYDDGWQGTGWYWCGYRWRSGLGWGGGEGWHGWRGGQRGGREFDGGRRSGGEIQSDGRRGDVRIQSGGGQRGGVQVQGGGGPRGGAQLPRWRRTAGRRAARWWRTEGQWRRSKALSTDATEK
jgi:hypothetical protein